MLGIIIDVEFLILKEKVLSLLSMKDMVTNKLDISIQDGHITFSGSKQPLAMENYFLMHRWNTRDLLYAFYTGKALRTIHRSFGHPSISSTEGLLRRTSGGKLTKEVRNTIEDISRSCVPCHTSTAAQRHFKLTVGPDDLRFNHSGKTDTMFSLASQSYTW